MNHVICDFKAHRKSICQGSCSGWVLSYCADLIVLFQMFFVILTFSEHHVDHFLKYIKQAPKIGDGLHKLIKEFFDEQKRKLHRSPGDKFSEQVSKHSL
jgi:hypothetical protein